MAQRISKSQVSKVLKELNNYLVDYEKATFIETHKHFNNTKTYSLHISKPGSMNPQSTSIADARIKDVMAHATAMLTLAKSINNE